MTNEDMKALKEKVRALLMKAADAAASPAEAEGAMRLAQKLMAKHQISEDQLGGIGADDWRMLERVGEFHKKKGWYAHPIDRLCAVTVGKFCGVVPFLRTDDDGKITVVLFGLDSDVEMASWMLAAFRQQMEHDWEIFKRFQMESKRLVDLREARISFTNGFSDAVNKRLENWMFRDAPQSPAGGTGSGTDLVVRKRNLAIDELASRGIHLGRSKAGRAGGKDSFAAGAGFNSGSAANVGGQGVGKSAIAIGAR